MAVFTQRNFAAQQTFSTEVEFYWQKLQNRDLCHPLGELRFIYGSLESALSISY